MNPAQRKEWNDTHKVLTEMMANPDNHDKAKSLFMSQHAKLYSSTVEPSSDLHYEDMIFDGISEAALRAYPTTTTGTKNSIVWHLWHITRIEDLVLNLLVANTEQVLDEGNWTSKMNLSFCDTGNGMSGDEVAQLSRTMDIQALIAYRAEVGLRTRVIVSDLDAEQMKQKVTPNSLNRILEKQALKPGGEWLLDYWGRKKASGFLLGPATRHNFIHLNKSMRIKEKLMR